MAARNVHRGEVYVCNLRQWGGILRKDRPAVVIQNESGNAHSPETILAGIRSDSRGRSLPVLVPIPAGAGGLNRDSQVDTGHLLTVPQDQLGRRIGALPPELMAAVDRALRVSLGLD